MNKEKLKNDLCKVAEKNGVSEFIFVFSYMTKTGDVIEEVIVSSITQGNEKSEMQPFFQWLRRVVILKLQ